MRMINESKEKKKNPEKTPRSASAVMRRRAAVSMTVLVVMGAAVAGKLFKVSIVDNSKYETLANNYHFGTMTLDANRGAIYDANGTALAWSATVYNIYVDPKLYRDEIKEIEKSNDKKKSAAEEKGEQAANLVDVTQLEQSIVSFLSEKLEIINLQFARRKAFRREFLHWSLIAFCALLLAGFAALAVVNSPYLGWDFSDPETAVMGTTLHAFEWGFARLAPFALVAALVGVFLTRKKA